MITECRILPSLPMMREDYLISRSRMSLVTRLNYLRADALDYAQMFALGDQHHDEKILAQRRREKETA